MNGLEIIAIGIIILCSFTGYRIGFLRVIYSLFAWILVLAFVTWATPYLTNYLEENTSLYASVQAKCLNYMEKMAEEKLKEQADTYGQEKQSDLENSGIWLPESLIEDITGTAVATADDILKSTGIYEEIASAIAHFIIEGIAFFITLLIAGIIMHWISNLLNLVSHIPILHSTNKILGAGAGAIKGIVIIWLILYIIALFGASELGSQLFTYIGESRILSYLYENNLLMQIVMAFF